VGSAYWAGLLRWLRETVAGQDKVSPEDLELLSVADSPEEVVEIIKKAHSNGLAAEPPAAVMKHLRESAEPT
jgi:hypothetical protein